ncbi:MAG: hypothetical protein ABIR47_00055 [Candidatus Kapaibacterium sp.]
MKKLIARSTLAIMALLGTSTMNAQSVAVTSTATIVTPVSAAYSN